MKLQNDLQIRLNKNYAGQTSVEKQSTSDGDYEKIVKTKS